MDADAIAVLIIHHRFGLVLNVMFVVAHRRTAGLGKCSMSDAVHVSSGECAHNARTLEVDPALVLEKE